MMTTSQAGARRSISACIWAAVSTGTIDTPSGAGRSTVETSVTSAPRRTASSASAYPCLPLLRLAITRTASIGSRVPPALINDLQSGQVGGGEQAVDGSHDRFG